MDALWQLARQEVHDEEWERLDARWQEALDAEEYALSEERERLRRDQQMAMLAAYQASIADEGDLYDEEARPGTSWSERLALAGLGVAS